MQGRHFGMVRVFRSPPGVGIGLICDVFSNTGFDLRPFIHAVRDFATVLTLLPRKYLQALPLSCRIGKLLGLPMSMREDVIIMFCPLMSSGKEIVDCSEECALYGKYSNSCLIGRIAIHIEALVEKTGDS